MKASRQQKILEIITQKSVPTQSELLRELEREGFKSTQATVSRDLKELGLVKVPAGGGNYRYALPSPQQMGEVYGRMERLFREVVTFLEKSENLIVIRTLPGSAHAVASCLDSIAWQEIIGTVAGDDTILVVVKPKKAVPAVLKRLRSFL